MLDIVAGYHRIQFQGKRMIQTQENGNKNLILGLIYALWAQIWIANIFFKCLASAVIRYHGQRSSCTISEKTNDPILTKFSEEQTDGRE